MNIPNFISHIYASCASLDKSGVGINREKSEAFWQDFDGLIVEILPLFKLKNLATLAHGL